jgi:dTDP-glucose 4,6-dehydratase
LGKNYGSFKGKKMRTILITGAAGFVGHHMVEHLLKNTEDKIIGVDCLNYSGTWDRLRDVDVPFRIPAEFTYTQQKEERGVISAYNHPRFTPLVYDFRQPAEPNLVKELSEVTHILHMGAESHVDHSIDNPMKFAMSNVVGTINMLNLARELKNLELFLYFSTDEVFGPAPLITIDPGNQSHGIPTKYLKGFSETDVHDPKNPYAASKSAAEQFVTSYANTYGLPCIITRQMNIFGERQHPEKFIPLCINAAINGGKVSIHATPDKKQAGMRHYIHGRNVADAHLFLLNKQPWLSNSQFPKHVESYHIVGELEVDNLTLAKTINEYTQILAQAENIVTLGAELEMVDFHSSRPGHDLRYALNGSKMKGIGWQPPKTFHQSLKSTIKWSLRNMRWLQK